MKNPGIIIKNPTGLKSIKTLNPIKRITELNKKDVIINNVLRSILNKGISIFSWFLTMQS